MYAKKSVLIALRKCDSKTDIIPHYQAANLPIDAFGDRSFHCIIFLPKLAYAATDSKPRLYLIENNLTHIKRFVKYIN